MTALKTGKLPATHDERDLLFANYVDLATVLPKAPATFGHERSVPQWAMLGNGPDPSVAPGFGGAGDCVWAGAAHETMLWEHETPGGPLSTWTGKEVIEDYSAATGFDLSKQQPDGSNPTDQGSDVRDALNYRRKTGILDHAGKRHKIGAFVKLDPGNLQHVTAAAYLFGAVGIGIRFPASAMDQFDAGKPWSVDKGSYIDGGHYIPVVARRAGMLDVVTWAKVQKMTVGFFETYCDEAWAILSAEHLHGGKTPEGFNVAQLNADLKALTA